jgi:chaperone modulatory protein CbpM
MNQATESIDLLAHASHWISEQELVAVVGLAPTEIHELMTLEYLRIERRDNGEMRVSGNVMTWLRKASRLKRDFELDENAMVLAMSLLARIEDLEQQLHRLSCETGDRS